mmetsp:Transcript_7435/g.16062  ORF Transcript_7435/g.16062 Transcript_7435/m.16062 type:complete len:85 (+) Transcript_7435:133-387(+)
MKLHFRIILYSLEATFSQGRSDAADGSMRGHCLAENKGKKYVDNDTGTSFKTKKNLNEYRRVQIVSQSFQSISFFPKAVYSLCN